jgi:hypothetical protein
VLTLAGVGIRGQLEGDVRAAQVKHTEDRKALESSEAERKSLTYQVCKALRWPLPTSMIAPLTLCRRPFDGCVYTSVGGRSAVRAGQGQGGG